MSELSIEIVQGKDIEQCRELCNELMAFQKSKAVLAPEKFDSMNFDTRMKKSYDNALHRQVLVAKDQGIPVGYVFSVIENIDSKISPIPDWAPIEKDKKMMGFYPNWIEPPVRIGVLNNLYIRVPYRKTGLGSRLFKLSIEWLESFDDVKVIFTYISNGNQAALDFYLKQGFNVSHEVFGGFITAVYKSR